MIAACPTCGARYRIEAAKLPAEGARLRCARCQSVFRVQLPAAAAPRTAPPQRAAPEAPAAAAETPPQTGNRDPERLVLLAHPEPEEGKQLAETLASWGLDVVLAHDGVEAILGVQRALPHAVVLDAALPKMFGFQVCELMKRNESLRGIHVVLLGAIHERNRYRRAPGELYGADAYAERQDLPDALGPILKGFGVSIGSGVATPAGRIRDAEGQPVQSQGAATPSGPDRESRSPVVPDPAADPELGAEIEKAERLARIIVSDIALYNAEKFEAAVRSGDVLTAMAAELQEGRELLGQRVGPRVGEVSAYLDREMLRIAQSRQTA
jgi:predicted Zn finger-like uncharacterized protein